MPGMAVPGCCAVKKSKKVRAEENVFDCRIGEPHERI